MDVLDQINNQGRPLEEYNFWPDVLDGLKEMFTRTQFAMDQGGYFPQIKVNSLVSLSSYDIQHRYDAVWEIEDLDNVFYLKYHKIYCWILYSVSNQAINTDYQSHPRRRLAPPVLSITKSLANFLNLH